MNQVLEQTFCCSFVIHILHLLSWKCSDFCFNEFENGCLTLELGNKHSPKIARIRTIVGMVANLYHGVCSCCRGEKAATRQAKGWQNTWSICQPGKRVTKYMISLLSGSSWKGDKQKGDKVNVSTRRFIFSPVITMFLALSTGGLAPFRHGNTKRRHSTNRPPYISDLTIFTSMSVFAFVSSWPGQCGQTGQREARGDLGASEGPGKRLLQFCHAQRRRVRNHRGHYEAYHGPATPRSENTTLQTPAV